MSLDSFTTVALLEEVLRRQRHLSAMLGVSPAVALAPPPVSLSPRVVAQRRARGHNRMRQDVLVSFVLEAKEPVTSAGVARHFGATKGAACSALGRLVREGLLVAVGPKMRRSYAPAPSKK